MAPLDAITQLADYQRRSADRHATDAISEDFAAQEFAARYAGQLLFCHDEGCWYGWQGNAFREERTERPLHLVRELVRELFKDEPVRSRASGGKLTVAKGVEKFATADPAFARTSEHWNRDPFLLGTPGQTIDLHTGGAIAPHPDDGITKTTLVEPSDTADCPTWNMFLDQVTNGDVTLRHYLQTWCGYVLTGDTREHALMFVYGPGGNGKSVLLNTITEILGDYAATAAMDTFEASRSDRHPADLAMLRGARLVTASETEEGKPWAEARIKQMTGGDAITARFMRQDFFTFKPQFKLMIIGNHKPILHSVDEAARRRFNIVPFTHKPERPDTCLSERLRAEYPAILRWMIDGCVAWQRDGLVRPPIVVSATDEYFSDQDLFGQWLDEDCDVDLGNTFKWEPVADLYVAWKSFAERAGEPPGAKKAFSEKMRRHGFLPHRGGGGVRQFKFIQLLKRSSVTGDE